MQEGESVGNSPMLYHQAILEAAYIDHIHGDRLAGARVAAFRDHPRPHLVSVDNDILDGQLEVVNLTARRLYLDLEDFRAR